MNWMDLPDKNATKDGKFVILPIEYEKDLSYVKGCSKGPAAIIEASQQLEYYDEQFELEPYESGVYLAESLKLNELEPKEAMEAISEAVQKHAGKFVISLGGDHAVTYGLVQGFDKIENDFSVIILDAHSDLRDQWTTTLNHACVSKNICKNHEVGIIGMRSQDIEEAKFAKKAENVHIIKPYEYSEVKLKELLSKLKNKVYLSIFLRRIKLT